MKKIEFSNINKNKCLNIISWAMFVVVVLALCLQFGNLNQRERDYALRFEAMKTEAQALNEKWEKEYNLNNSGGGTVEEEVPQFTSGRECLLYAYEKLDDIKSCLVKQTGDISGTGTKLGISMGVSLEMQGTSILYEDGDMIIETVRYEEGNKNNQTKGRYAYISNGYEYSEISTKVKNENGNLSADYVGNFNKKELSYPASIKIYNVDKRAIVSEDYFEVIKDVRTKKIKEYQVTVTLNHATATAGYAKMLKEQANGGGITPLALPTFNYLQVSARIDAQGNIFQLNAVEKYTMPLNHSTWGKVDTSMTQKLTYYFLSVNEPITVEKPNISQ